MKSRTAFACAAALFVVPLVCCVTRAADHPPATASQTDWKSGFHSLTVDGLDRTFLLDVPRGLKPGAPLVLVFHGFTGSAQDVRNTTGFAAVAEQHGFVVV